MSIAKIGTTVNNVTDVLIEPHVEFFPGASIEENACNESQYIGKPRCRWTYPGRLLTGEQFYQLKDIVGNEASADVVIDIPTQTLSLETYTPLSASYSGVMHWPAKDVRVVHHNQWQLPEDGILFTNLVPT